jgi:TolA-binding protein
MSNMRSAVSLRRLPLVVLALACTAASLGAQSPARVPRPPRPVPAPVPAPAPFPALAPLLEMELARAGADMAHAIAGATIDAEALRDMAMAQKAMAVDRQALQAMARASAPAWAAIAAEGQALAMSVAPLAGAWDYRYETTRGYRTEAPEPWDAQDAADSLYREGRKALSGDAYRRAAELFRQIRERYPKSSYAPDAPYWEAFALQRLGGETNLRAAREALAVQQRDYPKAATRGDAASLSARIDGMLGRRDPAMAVQRTTSASMRSTP